LYGGYSSRLSFGETELGTFVYWPSAMRIGDFRKPIAIIKEASRHINICLISAKNRLVSWPLEMEGHTMGILGHFSSLGKLMWTSPALIPSEEDSPE